MQTFRFTTKTMATLSILLALEVIIARFGTPKEMDLTASNYPADYTLIYEDFIVPDTNIEEIPVEIECHDCSFHGKAIIDDKDHYAPMVKCPECDSFAIEILNGKDIVVKNIVIEKPDDD